MMRADLIERSIIASCFAISADYADTLDSPRKAPGGGFVKGTKAPPTPVSAGVLDHRVECCERLASWAKLVAEERDVHPTVRCARIVYPLVALPPHVIGPLRPARIPVCGCQYETGAPLIDGKLHALRTDDVVNLARFLEKWARWLSDQEFGGECQRELADSARKIERLAQGITTRRIPRLGPCPEVLLDDEEQARCTGTLVASLESNPQLLGQIRCSADPNHRWDSSEWMTLGRHIHRPQPTTEASA